jgi:PAS domain S-box-containing protein
MEEIDYKKIIAESSYGYVYYRLILDDNGTPCDYVYIEVNRAFEEMTGVKGDRITGKKGTEVSPFENDEISQRIQLYGSSVLNNKKIVEEQYSEYLHKWFKVEISPQQDLYFTTIFTDITELKKSREKFEQYVKYSPYGIYVTDSNGKIILVNPVLCSSIGYSEEELLNKSVIDLLNQANRTEGMKGIKKLLETDSDSRDLLLEKKSGEHIWVALKTVKLPDGNFFGFLRDISDRKEAETGLKQFAMFNKTLLDTIPVPVYYKDIDGRYLGLNRAMEKLYGRNRDEVVGKIVSDISPSELAERYKLNDDKLIQNPGVQMFEEQWIDSAGETHDIIFHKATFNNTNGSVGGIVGAIVDITGLKKTHRELELYFKAIQSVAQPVLLTDSSGNIIRVNNAFIDMYGFSFEELKGENPNVLNPGKDVYINFGYSDEEYDDMFRSMWKSIADPDKGTWEGVLINRKKDVH